jgi:hypothetical protein
MSIHALRARRFARTECPKMHQNAPHPAVRLNCSAQLRLRRIADLKNEPKLSRNSWPGR